MAYSFTFGKVAKKINSTAQPTTSAAYSVVFKRQCSMEHPVIYINYSGAFPDWNYAHCGETGKYYWIDDITWLKANLLQVSMTIDPLATYKSAIMATSAIIMYGFNADSSGASYRLQDARQYVSNNPQIKTASEAFGNGIIDQAGCYILGTSGKEGAVSYALTLGELKQLLTSISTTWEGLADGLSTWDDATSEFMKKYAFGGTAMENIRSCIWVPFAKSKFSGGSTSIVLGMYDTGVSGMVVNADAKHVEDISIAIPWPAEDWKRMNCQLQLYIPFFGKMGIPVNQCNDDASITIRVGYSLCDGGVSVNVETSGGYIVYAGSTNVSAQYAVGASNIDIGRTISSISDAVGNVMQFGGTGAKAGGVLGALGAASGALLGAATSAGNVIQSIAPINNAIGTMSGRSMMVLPNLTAELKLFYYQPIDDPGYQGKFGFPVFRVGTPVAGYCQTENFSVAASGATPAEIQYINAALDSGCFIE